MRTTELVVVAAAAALLAPALAGASIQATRALPDCLGHPQIKPKEVVFACADGNFYADHLTWIGWGGPRAVGLGTAHLNDCEPDCAAGHFHRYSTILILGGTQRCPNGESAYRTVTWAFVGRSPYPPSSPGTLDPRQSFPCRRMP
jgi:hypothetical protein